MPLHKMRTYWKVPQRWMLGLLVLVTIYHWAVLFDIKLAFDLEWAKILNQWDSGWYSDIITGGYKNHNFAFYPLYPLAVRSLQTLLPSTLPIGLLGAILSSVLFGFYCFLITLIATKGPALHGSPKYFCPPSPLAWFLMLWSPASFCFQTHHTEALFLLLSVAAFLACEFRRFALGAIIAGLCALTKNQGIFVAISTGFWWASSTSGWLRKCRNFILSGLISGAFFSFFMIYSYIKTGDITAFYSAQSHWRPEMTGESFVKALWFGNPWQNTNLGSIERYALFWLLVVAAMGIWKKHKPIGLYVALFVGVMPLSGEFVGTFRYSSVLWPAWFWFAEKLQMMPKRPRVIATTCVVLFLLYLNHQTTRNYALGRWSY